LVPRKTEKKFSGFVKKVYLYKADKDGDDRVLIAIFMGRQSSGCVQKSAAPPQLKGGRRNKRASQKHVFLKCVLQPKIAKNSLKTPILGVQGRSR